ncbi:MAG: tetratricopeptide repeat protein, partial [Planctomycetaceae bacterium]|nr:tetratricopeptide repeat protein [Planctomycetaceae bacterium]
MESYHALLTTEEIQPATPDQGIALGQHHFDRGEYEKSLVAFRNVVRMSPEDGSAWLTIAHISQILKNHKEAAQAAREVLRLDSDSEQAHLILAESLRQMGHCDRAIPHYETVIRNNPNHVQALYGYGRSLLATGDLECGWLGFEARQICEAGTWGNHFLPDWNGETGKLCTVLAYGEGGIASEIQFASCLPDLARQVGHCFVECNAILRTLFERSFPNMTVISQSGEAIVPDQYPGMYFDSQIAFGSLPRFFRSDFEQFSQTSSPYLIADLQKTAHWKRLFDDL